MTTSETQDEAVPADYDDAVSDEQAEPEADDQVESEVEDQAEPDEDDQAGEKTPAPAGRMARLRSRLWSGRSRRTRIATVALAALLVLSAAGTGWLYSGRAIFGVYAGQEPLSFLPSWLPDNVAFRYGDRLVTVDELNEHVQMLQALYRVQPPRGDDRMDEFRRDVAKSYAVSLILDKAAADHGIHVADKQARDTLSRFVTQRLGAGPQAYSQFIDTLANAGTSERVVLEELKRRLAMTQLFDTVTRNVPRVSEQDVWKAFSARKDKLGTPERRRISNIVVQTQDEAKQVLAAIKGGAPFDEVARRRSLDARTSGKGGALGAVARGQLEKNYGSAAFKANEGELFGPVKSKHGWNVGRVERILPPEPARFDEIKDELKRKLQAEAALDRWRSWLRDTIAAADVAYADKYRPAHPDAPPELSPGGQPAPAKGKGPR